MQKKLCMDLLLFSIFGLFVLLVAVVRKGFILCFDGILAIVRHIVIPYCIVNKIDMLLIFC